MKKAISFFLTCLIVVISSVEYVDATSETTNQSDTNYLSMLARAESIVNYEWIPSQRIATWNENPYNGKMYFEEGETIRGVPYTLFSWELGFDSLLSSKQYEAKASINYSTEHYCSSVSANRVGPAYGNCCATFVSEVFGGNFMNGANPRYDGVGTIKNSSFSTTYSQVTVDNLNPGDALSNTNGGHIIWIGSISENAITIYESTPPISQKVVLNREAHTNDDGYLLYGDKVYNIVTKSNEYIWDGLFNYQLSNEYSLPLKAYATNEGNIDVYDSIEGSLKSSSLNNTKLCFIDAVYTNGWCHITYEKPEGGAESGYVFTDTFFNTSYQAFSLDLETNISLYANYYSNNLLCYVPSNTTVSVVGEATNMYQIIYEMSSGGFRSGWINKSDLPGYSESYQILYLAEGGNNVPDYQTKPYDESVVLSAQTPQKQASISFETNGGDPIETYNYCWDLSFSGWNTKSDGTGEVYYPGETYSINANLTLFAQWSNNQTVGVLPTPTRNRYDFVGWFTSIEDGKEVEETDIITENTTIYAKWIYNPSDYDVIYDANGGTDSPMNQIKLKGTNLILSNKIPKRTNYEFYGWTTEKDSKTVIYNPGDIYTVDKDVVLYAVWEETNAQDTLYGDVNNDGFVNNLDRLVLSRYLAKWENYSNIDLIASDVNCDGAVNNLDRLILTRYLARWEGYSLGPSEVGIKSAEFVYGKSEMGKDLVCYSISSDNYEKTILLNFAIHGFEDEYDADGQVLVDTANQLIEYYKTKDDLNNCKLLIVPCANPDGLYDGNSNNGFGRCNANGIDLNRDFDANYKAYSNSRNYTPYAFSAKESCALRDLCYEYSPDIVIDFHGWLDYTIGDIELAEVFYKNMLLSHHVSFTSTNASGYFANWAHQQGALGLLVEFTNSSSVSFNNLTMAINDLIAGNYDCGSGDYELDENLGKFDNVSGYTLSTDKITTYAAIDVPFNYLSYIDGSTDLCDILKIYKNGWAKVSYPITNGTKTAYCYLSAFIDPLITVNPYQAKVGANTSVYKRSDLNEIIGTVWSADVFYVVADNGSEVQIIYPLDTGGWKLGWISKALLE